MAKTNIANPILQEGVKFDDVSFYGERQCYKYFIKDANTDVNVRFAQYSGIASFSFNPKDIPLKFEDAVYKKAEFGNAALIISARNRAINATSTGLYYLCVFSHMTATYSIQVIEAQPNQQYHTLEDSWDEQGEVAGKNLTVYLYKAPPLDFKGQDISIEFQLTSISGETPRMYASFCKDSKVNPRKCTEKITNETIAKPPYIQARAFGKGLSINIDHDEELCQTLYNNECYYTLVVEGQSKSVGDLAQYSVTSMHSQQNYYVLQEGQSISDYITMGQYRYYSFTIPPPNPQELKGPKIRNITFQLNSLHGDADLFISKKQIYPNKMDYEKNSVKTSDSYDLVFFDNSNGKNDLTGTYYIGVYSYQYSTYSLVANVERVNQEGKIVSYHGLNPDEGKQGYLMVEGIAVRGSMDNFEGTQLYRIEIKQLEGYEKAIKIQLSPLENHFKIFAQFGSPPKRTDNSPTWRSEDHHLTIKPKDSNFKRVGTLYVLIIPRPLFLEQFNIWMTYSFMLSYTTEDSYFYLKSQLPQELKQQANTYEYFRHFVGAFGKDLSVSLTVFSGNPILYASFNAQNKWPQSTTQGVISSKGQALMVKGGGKGKALFFTSKNIKQQNRACSSAIEESVDPCVLFASVFCEGDKDDCRYAIKLTYESSAPQPLILGTPQHNIVKDGSFHYYYIVIKEKTIQEGQNIMASLQSMRGNADLYMSFKDTPLSSNPDTWELPNQSDYAYKSTQQGLNNQDMIQINAFSDKNLKECFSRFNSRYGTERECALIFGIYSPPSNVQEKDTKAVDLYSSRYNFVVYMDLQQLMSQAPVSGFVQKGEFQYFQYESTCDDCTLLISLSTVGQGDPDLYVNFGQSRGGFPTREEHHMQSSTFKSEMISIDLKHPYFKANNLKSMKGPFIIGVYGAKRSNFTLVVSQDKHPIQLLQDNTAMKASQEPFEVTYYTWYNTQTDNGKAKDFKVVLNVKNGQADIYVNTYVEDQGAKNSEQSNLLARLPKSKRDTQWVVENIDAKSSASKKELLVLNNERSYCTQCFYLIGVVTHDLKTDYSLQVDLLDADFKNAQILRLGESYETLFKTEIGDRRRVYRFIIDEDAPLQFVQSVKNTKVSTTVSFSESGENPILTIHNNYAEELSPEDKNFIIGKMYYIIVNELQNSPNATHTIMLMQNRSIIRLADGLPTQLRFQGAKDVSKLMLFTIPDGSYTFTVNVKTKVEGFYPRLYVKYYADIESKWRDLEFPPGGEPSYFICKNWDYKMGVMNYEERFDDIKGGKAGLALNLIESSTARDNIQNAEVIITVSATPVLRMIEGQTYIGTLAHNSNYKIYQIDELLLAKTGYLMIDFTACIGDPEFVFIDNPNQPANSVKANLIDEAASVTKNGRQYKYVQLPRQSLYVIVRQKQFQSGVDSQKPEQDLSADFIIKARYNSRINRLTTEYYLPNNGKMAIEQKKGVDGIGLRWGQLYWSDALGTVHYGENVNYTVVASKDPRARLDSQCVMRKEVAGKFVMAQFDTQNKNSFQFKTPTAGERYYVNVIATVSAPMEEESELIPYQPLELYIPEKTFLSKFVLLVFVVIALAFLAGALYYYKQSKETEQRLEYEMADVRNVANVTSYPRAIEMTNLNREEKYKNFAKVGEYEGISITDGVDESQYGKNEQSKSPSRAQL